MNLFKILHLSLKEVVKDNFPASKCGTLGNSNDARTCACDSYHSNLQHEWSGIRPKFMILQKTKNTCKMT